MDNLYKSGCNWKKLSGLENFVSVDIVHDVSNVTNMIYKQVINFNGKITIRKVDTT
jgi:hypothetical protein